MGVLQCSRPLQSLLVGGDLGCLRRGVQTAELCNAEDGFPAADGGVIARDDGRVAKAGGDEGALGPAILDVGEVPVDYGGRGVAVELVTNVDELLG